MEGNNRGVNDFKLTLAEWRGRVIKTLEVNEKNIDDMKDRLNCMDKKIIRLQIRVGAIAASVTFIMYLVFKFLIK